MCRMRTRPPPAAAVAALGWASGAATGAGRLHQQAMKRQLRQPLCRRRSRSALTRVRRLCRGQVSAGARRASMVMGMETGVSAVLTPAALQPPSAQLGSGGSGTATRQAGHMRKSRGVEESTVGSAAVLRAGPGIGPRVRQQQRRAVCRAPVQQMWPRRVCQAGFWPQQPQLAADGPVGWHRLHNGPGHLPQQVQGSTSGLLTGTRTRQAGPAQATAIPAAAAGPPPPYLRKGTLAVRVTAFRTMKTRRS